MKFRPKIFRNAPFVQIFDNVTRSRQLPAQMLPMPVPVQMSRMPTQMLRVPEQCMQGPQERNGLSFC
jgi:UDP:flavonoid glycosyltransferase YjiC (YdhE family)